MRKQKRGLEEVGELIDGFAGLDEVLLEEAVLQLVGLQEVGFGWLVRGAADTKRDKHGHLVLGAIARISCSLPRVPAQD